MKSERTVIPKMERTVFFLALDFYIDKEHLKAYYIVKRYQVTILREVPYAQEVYGHSD